MAGQGRAGRQEEAPEAASLAPRISMISDARLTGALRERHQDRRQANASERASEPASERASVSNGEGRLKGPE